MIANSKVARARPEPSANHALPSTRIFTPHALVQPLLAAYPPRVANAARISLPRVPAGMGKMPAQFGPGRKTSERGACINMPTPFRNAADGPKSAGGFPHEMRDGLDSTAPIRDTTVHTP